MKTRTHLLAVVSALSLLVSLTGCGGLSEYEQGRLDNLNSAVDEFDPDSISEVVCNVGGGEVALHVGYTRLIVFEGADSWQATVDRLKSLGYTGTNEAPTMSMSRPEGLIVAGRLIEKPGAEPDLEEHLLNNDCSVPPDGAVAIQFEERTSAPSATDG